MVIITDMDVAFSNDTDFEALAAPYDSSSASDKKAIYLVLNFSGADAAPAILTDPERNGPVFISLPAGGEPVVMSLTGSINSNPAVSWKNGDVRVHLKYKIEAFPAATAVTDITDVTPAAPELATDPVASPGEFDEGFAEDGLWEPNGDTQLEETEPTEPEDIATPATPATPETPPEETVPVASDGTLPEEPPPQESPQPPDADSGVE
jgi:hypothetical protein